MTGNTARKVRRTVLQAGGRQLFLSATCGPRCRDAALPTRSSIGVDNGNLNATLDGGHLRLSANAGQERLAADVEIRPEKTQWRLNLKHNSAAHATPLYA